MNYHFPPVALTTAPHRPAVTEARGCCLAWGVSLPPGDLGTRSRECSPLTPNPPAGQAKSGGHILHVPMGGFCGIKLIAPGFKSPQFFLQKGQVLWLGGRRWHLAAGVVPHLLVTWHWDMGQGCGDRYG